MRQEIALYHYSVEKYDNLLTLIARGKEKEGFDSDVNDPFSYNKSMSFFLEPIPRDLPSLYDNKHHFWKEGVELYEYIIPLSHLKEDTPYIIVETREKTDLIRNKQDWDSITEDTLDIKMKYLKEINELQVKKKYKGMNISSFLKGLRTVPLEIRKDFINAYSYIKKDKDFDLLDKYAAYVPHVMFYVDKQVVKYSSVKKIVLGKRNVSTEHIVFRW